MRMKMTIFLPKNLPKKLNNNNLNNNLNNNSLKNCKNLWFKKTLKRLKTCSIPMMMTKIAMMMVYSLKKPKNKIIIISLHCWEITRKKG